MRRFLSLLIILASLALAGMASMAPAASAARNPKNYPPYSCAAYRNAGWHLASISKATWRLRRHDLIHVYGIADHRACMSINVTCSWRKHVTMRLKGGYNVTFENEVGDVQVDVTFGKLRPRTKCVIVVREWAKPKTRHPDSEDWTGEYVSQSRLLY